MKKEILLLSTPENTGKTTSIQMLHGEFLQKYKLKTKEKQEKYEKDFREPYDNDPKLNGHVVGFASGGDEPSIVKDNCEFFKNNKCTICITACRTRGKTKSIILEFAKTNSYNVSFFDFISRTNNDEANTEKARMMLDRIKYLIQN